MQQGVCPNAVKLSRIGRSGPRAGKPLAGPIVPPASLSVHRARNPVFGPFGAVKKGAARRPGPRTEGVRDEGFGARRAEAAGRDTLVRRPAGGVRALARARLHEGQGPRPGAAAPAAGDLGPGDRGRRARRPRGLGRLGAHGARAHAAVEEAARRRAAPPPAPLPVVVRARRLARPLPALRRRRHRAAAAARHRRRELPRAQRQGRRQPLGGAPDLRLRPVQAHVRGHGRPGRRRGGRARRALRAGRPRGAGRGG